MLHHVPLAKELPIGFWLNSINSFIAQVMVQSFTPRYFFGVSEEPKIVAARELALTF